MAARIPARLSAAEGRHFGLTVGVALLALAALGWWRGGRAVPGVLGAVGGVLVVAAVVIPENLGPVQRVWMALAHALSRVTTPLFMGIVYFLVLTPFGLLRRTLGRSPLHRSPTNITFWHERSERRSNLERQF